MIYLDYAASAPPYPEAAETVQTTMLEQFGNPGGIHGPGGAARGILQRARKTLSGLLNVRPEEVFFTSGGTEANNWAVKMACAGEKRHIVAAATEHRSILESIKSMEKAGYSVTYVYPGGDGVIPPSSVESALRPDTALLAVHAVNNETGVIQDVAALAAIARERGVRYLADGVQSFGHVMQPLRLADLITLSAHKLGGPRGVGCLVVRYPHRIGPLIHGGGQEFGLRSGTENVPGIAGFALAAELAVEALPGEESRLKELSAALLRGLREAVPGTEVNGEGGPRHPGILNCRFPGITGEEMAVRLDRRGICVSPGAACVARDSKPSHVLLNMGYPERRAMESLRFSLGRLTTMEEIQETIKAVKAIAGKEI